jgi:hypothetical protein
MLDIQGETLLSLAAAAKRLPPGRRGRPVHISAVLRWITCGVRKAGERVRLEGARIGGRWVTSVQALQRFAERLTPNLDGNPPPLPRPSTARQRASERAARELAAIGI